MTNTSYPEQSQLHPSGRDTCSDSVVIHSGNRSIRLRFFRIDAWALGHYGLAMYIYEYDKDPTLNKVYRYYGDNKGGLASNLHKLSPDLERSYFLALDLNLLSVLT